MLLLGVLEQATSKANKTTVESTRSWVFIDKQSKHNKMNSSIVPKRGHWCDLVMRNRATIVLYFQSLE